MEVIFMDTENSKTNKPHKFVLTLSKILDLRSSNKHIALQNLSIYYTWKNITWNFEFELPDGSYSISDDTEYIIQKHETSAIFPFISVYINRIDNRLVFKTKHGYKL